MSSPTNPFASIPQLFTDAAASELRDYLSEIHALVLGAPSLLTLVNADLDAHGCAKKALRLADARWQDAHSGVLHGILDEPAEVDPKTLRLGVGRPRTAALVVLVAMLLRGFFGAGFKSRDVELMLHESVTLRVFLANHGHEIPAPSTLTELVNAVTNPTRERVLEAQLAMVLGMGWDDFRLMLQDSTHVAGNTAWPVDSRLLVDLVARLVRVGASLPRLGLPALTSTGVDKCLSAMRALDREISLAPAGPRRERNRRKGYEKLLRKARRVLVALSPGISEREAELRALDVAPSRKVIAARAVALLRADFGALAQVTAACDARVIRELKVPMADKKLSVSDPDVGFIAKGQRDPVVGYKPQIARSGGGFITGLLLPKGNAADSGQLLPMFESVIAHTGVIPAIVSVDDGYASQANVEALRARGVEVPSINGAKGRALTSRADWDSDAYAMARAQRSAIESIMFTLKYGYDFGEVARRGLAAVHGELLEKALAFNFCHMTRARRRVAENAAVAPELAAAA